MPVTYPQTFNPGFTPSIRALGYQFDEYLYEDQLYLLG